MTSMQNNNNNNKRKKIKNNLHELEMCFELTWGNVCCTWSLGMKRLVGKLRKIKNNLPELKMHQMRLESHLSILLVVVVVVGFWWFDARWCWFMVLLLAVRRCNLVCVH